jgi:iron complex transport system ATP-binding protein
VPASPAEVLALRGVGVQRWSDGAMVELLRDVDLTARAGEHWIVMGPNGAGKTTLAARPPELRTLAGASPEP